MDRSGLHAGEQRIRALTENGHDAITLIGPDGMVCYSSPSAERVFGYPAGDVLGTDAFDFVHPDDRVQVAQLFAEVAGRPGASAMAEFRTRHADGSWIWVESVAQNRLADADVGAVVLNTRDVTERKLVEERLRMAEEKYRAMVEQLPAIVYTDLIDGEDVENWPTVFISPQIERILGYTPEEWIGDPELWARCVHPADRDAAVEEDSRELAQAQAREDEREETAQIDDGTKDYRIYAKDGRLVWLRDHATVVRDEQGIPRFQQGILTDVTEVKRAEEQARAAEARYRSLVQNLPIGFYIKPVEGGPDLTAYASPQLEGITGYPPDEWLFGADAGFQNVHDDDREALLAAERHAAETGEPYREDFRIVKPDGTIVWVHDETVLVRDTDGAPLRWEGFLQDVTARKLAEERHKEAEEKYRTLIEHLPAIVYMDPNMMDGPSIYVSPQVQAFLGYPPERFTSDVDAWYHVIHPDDLDRQLGNEKDATESGYGFRSEYRLIARNGRVVWVDDRSEPIRDESGEIAFWHGVMLDITERKNAEERAREAETEYRTLVEGIPGVVYVESNDPMSSTLYLSPQIEQLIGYPPEDFIGEPTLWDKVLHPDDVDRVWQTEIANYARREPYTNEYRLVARDGSVVWVSDHAFPLLDHEGAITRWLGVMTDVTTMKEAEEELTHALAMERQVTERLRELDDMKDRFLTAVSHELRTPLTGVLGSAITLDGFDESLDPDDRRELTAGVLRSARKLDRLLKDLLDVDRLSRGVLQPRRQPVDLQEVADHVIEGSTLRSSREIALEAEAVTANVDVAMVERILENLLVNAAKHTPAETRIWVRATRSAEGVLLAVEDDGPGVPDELRGTIFEPFLRGADYPDHSPGIGIGLSLVAQFAQLHGGRAWVEDRVGGGASFRVLLPDEIDGR